MLFESICWQDGQFQNLQWHTARVQATRAALFGVHDHWQLDELLASWQDPISGLRLRQMLPHDQLLKLRFDYNQTDWKISWEPYLIRKITTLQLVEAPYINYEFKFSDRSALDSLVQASPADDVIICQNGYLRDSSYANLVFSTGARSSQLYTPATPLLPGTRRAALIASGQVRELDIHLDDLRAFKWVHLVNAMLPLGRVRLVVGRIVNSNI
jgi:4-amino-4-deoxychorismate lyase